MALFHFFAWIIKQPYTELFAICLLTMFHDVQCSSGPYLNPYRSNYDSDINSQRIPQSQQYMERILTAIEEKLDVLSDRQKSERTTSNMINTMMSDLQIMNLRIQNMEDQMARSESSNKMKIDKILENLQKEEFTIEQLAHKIEKHQQQVNNRLMDIENVLEKVNNAQEDLTKDIRKINSAQNELISNTEEITENMQDIKITATESYQNLNISQHTFHQHLLNMIRNVPSHADITDTVKRLGEQLNNTTANGIMKCTQNDAAQYSSYNSKVPTLHEIQKDLQGESVKLIAAVDNMYSDLRQKMQMIESISKEMLGINNKIYKKLDNGDICDNVAVQEVENAIRRNINQLEVKMKQNFELILVEQHGFMDNCHRLQLNEEQIEEKLVIALEKLIEMLNNRTISVMQDLIGLSKQMQSYQGNYNLQMEDLYKFFRSQGSHITRTITHTMNKINEMDKHSKQLQNSINSIKDVCYNMSTDIQAINKDVQKKPNCMVKDSAIAFSSSEMIDDKTSDEESELSTQSSSLMTVVKSTNNKIRHKPSSSIQKKNDSLACVQHTTEVNSNQTGKKHYEQQMDELRLQQKSNSSNSSSSSSSSSSGSSSKQDNSFASAASAPTPSTNIVNLTATHEASTNYASKENITSWLTSSSSTINRWRFNTDADKVNISETFKRLLKPKTRRNDSPRRTSAVTSHRMTSSTTTTSSSQLDDTSIEDDSDLDENDRNKKNQVWKFSNELTNVNAEDIVESHLTDLSVPQQNRNSKYEDSERYDTEDR